MERSKYRSSKSKPKNQINKSPTPNQHKIPPKKQSHPPTNNPKNGYKYSINPNMLNEIPRSKSFLDLSSPNTIEYSKGKLFIMNSNGKIW